MVDRIAEPGNLLERARGGNGDALGQLLQMYRNYLELLAQTHIDSCLRRRGNASDIVQETFLEAHRDFAHFRGRSPGELVAWLRRILLRNVATLVEKQILAQKRDVRREVSLEARIAQLEQSSLYFEEALANPISTPSAQLERRELLAVMADQLAELPSDYRQVLVLRNLESLGFDEVARRMGRSSGAVRMLWLRALKRLREQLEREGLI